MYLRSLFCRAGPEVVDCSIYSVGFTACIEGFFNSLLAVLVFLALKSDVIKRLKCFKHGFGDFWVFGYFLAIWLSHPHMAIRGLFGCRQVIGHLGATQTFKRPR